MTNLRSHAAWRWLKPEDDGRGGGNALLEGDMASLYVYVVMLCAVELCRRTWWDESASRHVTRALHWLLNTFEFHRSWLVNNTQHWSLLTHYVFSLMFIMHCLIYFYLTPSLPKVCNDRWTQIISYNTTLTISPSFFSFFSVFNKCVHLHLFHSLYL